MKKATALPGAMAVEQLCLQCGLCCNGTLFADVKLQNNDDPARLAALGMPLRRRATRLRLPQPCPAFAAPLCRIYPDRPLRCRDFECRLLQRVQSAQLTVEAALDRIRRALAEVRAVETLLREGGARAEHRPLTHRYRRAMSQPLDLSEPGAADLRGEILLAMRRLMDRLHRDFLGEP